MMLFHSFTYFTSGHCALVSPMRRLWPEVKYFARSPIANKQPSKDMDLMLPRPLYFSKGFHLVSGGDLNEGGREADLGAEAEKVPPSL